MKQDFFSQFIVNKSAFVFGSSPAEDQRDNNGKIITFCPAAYIRMIFSTKIFADIFSQKEKNGGYYHTKNKIINLKKQFCSHLFCLKLLITKPQIIISTHFIIMNYKKQILEQLVFIELS